MVAIALTGYIDGEKEGSIATVECTTKILMMAAHSMKQKHHISLPGANPIRYTHTLRK
jgi:hypothetical protein